MKNQTPSKEGGFISRTFLDKSKINICFLIFILFSINNTSASAFDEINSQPETFAQDCVSNLSWTLEAADYPGYGIDQSIDEVSYFLLPLGGFQKDKFYVENEKYALNLIYESDYNCRLDKSNTTFDLFVTICGSEKCLNYTYKNLSVPDHRSFYSWRLNDTPIVINNPGVYVVNCNISELKNYDLNPKNLEISVKSKEEVIEFGSQIYSNIFAVFALLLSLIFMLLSFSVLFDAQILYTVAKKIEDPDGRFSLAYYSLKILYLSFFLFLPGLFFLDLAINGLGDVLFFFVNNVYLIILLTGFNFLLGLKNTQYKEVKKTKLVGILFAFLFLLMTSYNSLLTLNSQYRSCLELFRTSLYYLISPIGVPLIFVLMINILSLLFNCYVLVLYSILVGMSIRKLKNNGVNVFNYLKVFDILYYSTLVLILLPLVHIYIPGLVIEDSVYYLALFFSYLELIKSTYFSKSKILYNLLSIISAWLFVYFLFGSYNLLGIEYHPWDFFESIIWVLLFIIPLRVFVSLMNLVILPALSNILNKIKKILPERVKH